MPKGIHCESAFSPCTYPDCACSAEVAHNVSMYEGSVPTIYATEKGIVSHAEWFDSHNVSMYEGSRHQKPDPTKFRAVLKGVFGKLAEPAPLVTPEVGALVVRIEGYIAKASFASNVDKEALKELVYELACKSINRTK